MSRAPKPLPTPPSPPVLPRWIRQGTGLYDIETAMFSAGAALATLDPITRSEDPVGILWRKRLALSAAAAVSHLEGRREGEAQLRDTFALRKPGDDPGPAGRMLIGWRALGEARTLRSAIADGSAKALRGPESLVPGDGCGNEIFFPSSPVPADRDDRSAAWPEDRAMASPCAHRPCPRVSGPGWISAGISSGRCGRLGGRPYRLRGASACRWRQ